MEISEKTLVEHGICVSMAEARRLVFHMSKNESLEKKIEDKINNIRLEKRKDEKLS